MDRDLYAVLGVSSTSSEREIRRAFHELARKYHPDVAASSPGAARRFIEVSAAAETLLDPWRRAAYDRSRPRTSPVSPVPASGTTPPKEPAAEARSEPSTFTIIWRTIAAVAWVGTLFWLLVVHPGHDTGTSDVTNANGAVLWKATNYELDDGWGINLAGSGRRIQIYPGTSADLEVDSGYLSSGGHIAFLPPGTVPGYQGCRTALGNATSQAEPLDSITPGGHADLCSSGSTGDIAFVHVTGKNGTGLVMNITIWHYV